MIVYTPNKAYLKDVLHLGRSWTMVKTMRAVLYMGLFSTAVVLPVELMQWHEKIVINITVFSFLGVVLSILLVFRTNTAYDRWWEGRKQWGALVNHTRNLAVGLHSMYPLPNKAVRQWYARQIANFCYAFTDHMRSGARPESLILLTDSELERYHGKLHLPMYISYEIHQQIENDYRSALITPEDHRNLKPHTQALLDILGACERIKKTPIPFSYAVYIKLYILAYGLLLPFALVGLFGWFTIPVVMLIFFAFIGMELMAGEIEEPFGLDCNDLPTGTISDTIRDNVFELLTGAPYAHDATECNTDEYTKQF